MVAAPLALLALLQSGSEPDDSVRIHRDMIAAQRSFESTRRRLLPVSTSGSGKCDERVGRFCYWYDPEEPPPPVEPESIRRERAEFLDQLAQAARILPGDEWILAQRVRYLVEHGLADSAAALARQCPGWWCDALRGFALHVTGDVAAAEAAFDQALGDMPDEERCRWNDLGVALESDERDAYRDLDCQARDSANAELFWRATPLLTRPGNDVRTEWYARQIWVRALDNAITHHGMRLRDDLREVLIRYGWATAYGRRPGSYNPVEDVDVVGHEPRPAYPFLATDPDHEWPPGPERPRARFAPVFATLIDPVRDVQLARFRRGDSLIFVAGLSARDDTLFHDSKAWLVLSAGPERSDVVAEATLARGQGSVVTAILARSAVASLEVRDSVHRAWAVHRTVRVTAPERISDLLFTLAGDSLPLSLDAASNAAYPGVRIDAGRVIGVYWESYGHPEADSLVAISLTVEPVRPGFLGRVGQSLGLKRRVPPLRLAWTRHRSGSDPVAIHAIEVDLSGLGPGSYLLRVEVGRDRQAERAFEITRADKAIALEPGRGGQR